MGGSCKGVEFDYKETLVLKISYPEVKFASVGDGGLPVIGSLSGEYWMSACQKFVKAILTRVQVGIDDIGGFFQH